MCWMFMTASFNLSVDPAWVGCFAILSSATRCRQNGDSMEWNTPARARTDELFRFLRPGVLYSRPIPERHRLIFYLGHLEAFDWNQVCRQALDIPSFHPEFDHLLDRKSED